MDNLSNAILDMLTTPSGPKICRGEEYFYRQWPGGSREVIRARFGLTPKIRKMVGEHPSVVKITRGLSAKLKKHQAVWTGLLERSREFGSGTVGKKHSTHREKTAKGIVEAITTGAAGMFVGRSRASFEEENLSTLDAIREAMFENAKQAHELLIPAFEAAADAAVELCNAAIETDRKRFQDLGFPWTELPESALSFHLAGFEFRRRANNPPTYGGSINDLAFGLIDL